MSATITSGTTTVVPLFVAGYQSSRTGQSVFNKVLGRSYPDVALVPASPRRGTLRCVFASEADASACERLHALAAVFTFADPDVPTSTMAYVLDGSLTRQLDPETLELWVISIDYQEVIV